MFSALRLRVPFTYLLLVCAMACFGVGHTQEAHHDIPANAHYRTGEQGWACNDGFRQVSGLCVVDSDEVPSWGAFEVYDGQWRCRAGYHREGSYCVPAVAPAHASYVGGGERWECDWGFQKVASHCEEIKPPPSAYIDASGHEWVCYPGFERKTDRCVAPSTPDPVARAAPNP
jgi:hypothetical protein